MDNNKLNELIDHHYGGSLNEEQRQKLVNFANDVEQSVRDSAGPNIVLLRESSKGHEEPATDFLSKLSELKLNEIDQPTNSHLPENSSYVWGTAGGVKASSEDFKAMLDADLKANPDLSENGVQAGDTIGIPAEAITPAADSPSTETNLQ